MDFHEGRSENILEGLVLLELAKILGGLRKGCKMIGNYLKKWRRYKEKLSQ